jgi:hypothetical protein
MPEKCLWRPHNLSFPPALSSKVSLELAFCVSFYPFFKWRTQMKRVGREIKTRESMVYFQAHHTKRMAAPIFSF